MPLRLPEPSEQAGELLKTLPTGTTAHLAYFDADGVEPRPEAQSTRRWRPGSSRHRLRQGDSAGHATSWWVPGARAARSFSGPTFSAWACGLPLEAPFPAGSRVDMIDVGRPVTRNLAVDEVQADQTDLRKGKPVRVTARVFNAGLFPARDVLVRLVLEGKVRSSRASPLQAAAEPAGAFRCADREAGSSFRALSRFAAAMSFRLTTGDTSLSRPECRNESCSIDGEPGPSVFGNETYYLETALRLRLPGDEAKEARPTPYEPVRIAGAGPSFTLPGPGPYPHRRLCATSRMFRRQAGCACRVLSTSGGSLIIFVGDRVGAGAYPALEAEKLLPGRIGDPAVEAGPYRTGSNGSRITRSWLPLPTRCTETCEPCDSARSPGSYPSPRPASSPARTGGLPILLERIKGAGRCLLFAIPADNAWGDWAIHRLYLPIWLQVAGYVSDRLPGTGRVRLAAAGRARASHPA